MSCPSCSQPIELRTDPKTATYLVTEGGSRQATTEDDVLKEDPAHESPFFRLESQLVDQKRAQEVTPKLAAIQQLNEDRTRDNYGQSQVLRARFRQEKQDEKIDRTSKLKARLSSSLPLAKERPEDIVMAKNAIRSGRDRGSKPGAKTVVTPHTLQAARTRISRESIFPGVKKTRKKK